MTARGILHWAVLAAAFLVFSSGAEAARRVALVIGNSAYDVGPLANPGNDAEAIADALKGLDFDKIILVKDAGKQRMEAALAELANTAVGAEMAVVFFAGHGTEREGRNYLIPVDAKLARASDLDLQAVALSTVLDQIAAATRLKLVILDACRNNVFPLAGAKRAVNRGLARVEPEDNTLIAYAAKDGTVADDGQGRRHSPFTDALLKRIATPGIEVDYLFRLVRDDVLAATNRQQTPHIYGTLGSDRIYLKDGATAPVTPQVAIIAPKAPAATTPAPPAAPTVPTACNGVTVELAASGSKCIKPGSGESFRDCPDCPEMVVVPAGSFMMGSPETEADRERLETGTESPQIRVTIANPFAAGKFAVTFDEWDACVLAGGCFGNRPTDKGWGRGLHPVINVNWDEAATYADWLSRKTGKPYRLQSEAQREYVTRAGTTTPFWWGSSINPNQANYDGNSTYGGSKGEYRQRTVPVDSFKRNPWGLFNVHGNISEWTEDCWNDRNEGNPGDGSARTSGDCNRHVVRGGSWYSVAWRLRAAFRLARITAFRDDVLGFRVVRSLE